MTYLNLCNKTKNLAGITGPTITSVTATSPHINYMVCQFVKDAWDDIQSNPNLIGAFRYKSDETITIQAQTSNKLWQPSNFSLCDTIQWIYDKFYIIDDDGNKVKLIRQDYSEVNINYYTEQDTPIYVVPFTQTKFYLLPTNDEQETLHVDYIDDITSFSSNSDEPESLSEMDQMAIVYKALVSYAIYDDAQEILQYATVKDTEFTNRLFRKYGVSYKPKRVQFNVVSQNYYVGEYYAS